MAVEAIALGPNGLKVSPLGIGTWAWGDKLFWSYGNDYGAAQVREAFNATLDAGINFFDTAEVYGLGESERLLGQFMQQTDKPAQIATKFFPLPWRFNAQAVSDALTASLERLQVPQVALYQVHQPFDFLLGKRALMNALADEVQQGRIATVGVSNYSAEQMRQSHKYLAARGVPLAVNQVRYSLLTRQIESNGILATARELGITILAYSPLAQGLLTGKYTADSARSPQGQSPQGQSPQGQSLQGQSLQGQSPQGARRLDPRFNQSGLEKIAPVVRLLQDIGTTHQRTPAQVALNWLIAQGVIPIPGAKNADQARQNAGALGWSLTEQEIESLDRATQTWK